MEEYSLREKASHATKWSSITEIAARCVAPITNIILARLLTPEAFGVVATVTIVTSLADLFTDAGFQKYLVQHDFEDVAALNRYSDVAFWTNLAISLFLWALICVFNQPLAALVGNEGLGNVLVVASISLPLTSFSSIQLARFKREFQFKTLFYIRLVTLAVPFLITVPLAFITHSFWALIIGTIANNLANAVVLTWRSSWKPSFFYDFALFKEMFSYSWWILLESISVWLTSYIGTFIVGLYLSSYYVGLYKTSMTTVNQITALVTAATSMPLFAALSRLKDHREELFSVYCDYIGAIAVIVIPMGVGIYLYRDLITAILLGSQWTEASEFIGLWGLMSALSLVLGTYANGLYNAVGKTHLSFLAQILHLAVLIPVLLWSAPRGYEILYVWRSLVRLQFVLVELILMKAALRFPVSRLCCAIFPSVVCTGIMAVFDLAMKQLGDSVIWQSVCIGLCVIIYCMLMILFFKKTFLLALRTFGIQKKHQKEGN